MLNSTVLPPADERKRCSKVSTQPFLPINEVPFERTEGGGEWKLMFCLAYRPRAGDRHQHLLSEKVL